MPAYLVPCRPWTPRFCDGEVEVAHSVPRAGERYHRVEIPAENFPNFSINKACL
jgi:hypothetical protein